MPYLYSVVEKAKWYEGQGEPRQTVTRDHQCSQNAKNLSKENVELERQGVIDGVHVRGETVDDASNGCGVKK